MIRWLVASSLALPVPQGLLHRSEQEQWQSLCHPKRRREWLLGRWAAKRLLQATFKESLGLAPPLNCLVIRNDSYGVPDAMLDLGGVCWELPVAISISHSGEYAVSASAWDSSGKIGVDLERIEPRAQGFIHAYFRDLEIHQVLEVPPGERDLAITTIWSAKESALKAAGLGLSVDTRSVTCRIDTPCKGLQSWTPFAIDWNMSDRFERGDGSQENQICVQAERFPRLRGYWRVFESYVITLAVPAPLQ
ncbi:MAG: 4'-phosphopantetheinyl transferase family protein [Omnitrophica WOR_2 bacterium]